MQIPMQMFHLHLKAIILAWKPSDYKRGAIMTLKTVMVSFITGRPFTAAAVSDVQRIPLSQVS